MMNTHAPDLTPDPAHTADHGADPKRDALRARIEASERRIAERTLVNDARDAARAAGDYARANPGKVVAGALVLGLLIGLMTAPGRRAAASAAARVTGGTAKAARNSESRFAGVMTHALVTQGLQLLDDVLDGTAASRQKIDDLADKAVSNAQRLGTEAAETSGELARRTRTRAETAARDIAERLRK